MIIIGLTGSIAMGKTTVAKQFARLGIPVCDSDLIVHKLLAKNGKAVVKVARVFPESLQNDAIDRKILGKLVFGNDEKLKMLENILHPLVRDEQKKFIKQAVIKRKKLVILDIPLLFETKAEERCNYVITVSAPYFLQKQRAMRRKNMTAEKFNNIIKRQMPDWKKRKLSNFVINTGMGKKFSLAMIIKIFNIF
ncbi:MAG: dephospho-CoA kinase [Pseudomonadota bacterium]